MWESRVNNREVFRVFRLLKRLVTTNNGTIIQVIPSVLKKSLFFLVSGTPETHSIFIHIFNVHSKNPLYTMLYGSSWVIFNKYQEFQFLSQFLNFAEFVTFMLYEKSISIAQGLSLGWKKKVAHLRKCTYPIHLLGWLSQISYREIWLYPGTCRKFQFWPSVFFY